MGLLNEEDDGSRVLYKLKNCVHSAGVLRVGGVGVVFVSTLFAFVLIALVL